MSKKYQVEKSFILEAHKEACSDWKRKIEREFPEVFKKLEFDFQREHLVSVDSDDSRPLYIGNGHAPEGLNYRCLVVNEKFKMSVTEERGRQIITFTKK